MASLFSLVLPVHTFVRTVSSLGSVSWSTSALSAADESLNQRSFGASVIRAEAEQQCCSCPLISQMDSSPDSRIKKNTIILKTNRKPSGNVAMSNERTSEFK